MIKSLYPCFQHWSEKGGVYLVSDTHFDDSDRKLMGYNISNEDQFYLLNNTCHKNDTLIHLGDIGNLEYIKKLKCYKVLIMGNHDQSIQKMQEVFDEVYSGPLWISQKLVLSHEPIEIKAGIMADRIAFNIHGHDHSGGYLNDDYHFNIAQNVYGYIPLNLNQYIKSGKLNKIKDIHRVTIDTASERRKFIDSYCAYCGSQRCEGPDSEFGKGCKYFNV